MMANEKKMTAKILFIFVLAVSVFLLVDSIAAKEIPGVTEKEVVIGVSNPLSGPAALWGTAGLGVKAWADYVNEKGGVHGRKIKVILKDDGYNPTRALANLQEMKGKVLAVTALIGSALLNACKDFPAENNIPLIVPRGNPRAFVNLPKDKIRYIFFSFPDYEDEAEFLASYAVKNLGTKKITLFYQNDDYGKGGLAGVENALRKLPGQAEFVAPVPYEVTERALGGQALKLKESGADTMVIYGTMNQAAIILKEMAKLGYRPKIMASFPMADTVMFKLAGELWEGVYVAAPGYTGVPGVDPKADSIGEIIKRYEPNTAANMLMGVSGAVAMMYVVEGLKNTGRDLTADKLIEGMEKIKNWKPEGLGAPTTFSRDRHHGNNSSRLLQARGGKYVPITDFVSFKPRF